MSFEKVDISDWVVLIVDDEPDNLGVAEKVLTFNGATVYTAADGVAALTALETIEKLTCLLLDLSMPNMDGWELLKKLREDGSKWADVPVVALTAHAMLGDRERALAAGFDGYIAKPISIFNLIPDMQKACAEKHKKDAKPEEETPASTAEKATTPEADRESHSEPK